MNKLLFVISILAHSILLGQEIERGIYKGQKTQLFICYLTVSDSLIEVEYFNEKGGQIFGHFPPKGLMIDNIKSKPIFKSSDEKIKVYKRKNCFLIKNMEFGNMKVYKSDATIKEIEFLRTRYMEFKRTQKKDCG